MASSHNGNGTGPLGLQRGFIDPNVIVIGAHRNDNPVHPAVPSPVIGALGKEHVTPPVEYSDLCRGVLVQTGQVPHIVGPVIIGGKTRRDIQRL